MYNLKFDYLKSFYINLHPNNRGIKKNQRTNFDFKNKNRATLKNILRIFLTRTMDFRNIFH